MSLAGLEVTYITIEAGWKMQTLLNKFRLGVNCAAFPGVSPFDLVSKTIQTANDPFFKPTTVFRINIVGHGSRSGVQIGGHFVESSNFNDYEGSFRTLRKVLDAEGFIHIRGCAVGQNTDFLLRFARTCGVPVYAGTSAENVLLDFNFGDIVVANPNGSVQTTSRP
jgi:hypothetical protein